MKEAEDAESVCDGNENDIRILLDEIGAVEQVNACSACHKSAAMDPHHHRLLLSSRILCLPDVQVQAVFTLVAGDGNILNGEFCKMIGFIYPIVRSNIHRCFPAQTADRLLTYKGNPFVGNDVICPFTDKCSVDTPDGKRLVVVAVCNLLILAILRLEILFCFIHRFIIFSIIISSSFHQYIPHWACCN